MKDFLLFFAPLAFGLAGIGAVFYGAGLMLKANKRATRYGLEGEGVVYDHRRLYLTCGYCGQSVPSDNGFTVNPHKYTNICEEGTFRIDCPQGNV